MRRAAGRQAAGTLNVWMTPDRIPFAANGYAPPVTSDEAPSLASVAAHLSTQWDRFQKGRLHHRAERAVAGGTAAKSAPWQREGEPGTVQPRRHQPRLRAGRLLLSDPEFGGFGASTKFPARRRWHS
ncbi:MAG: hypothetical protein R3F11_10755 [Verrucomicrobiales bacterium]